MAIESVVQRNASVISADFSNLLKDDNFKSTLEKICDGSDVNPNRYGFVRWNIKMEDLKSLQPRLQRWFVMYPAESLGICNQFLSNYVNEKFAGTPREGDEPDIRLSVSLSDASQIRDLEPNDIERIVAIRGIVIRCSPVIMEMQRAVFRCQQSVVRGQQTTYCGNEIEAAVTNTNRVLEPTECPLCGATKSFAIVHERCSFVSKQLLKVQESPADSTLAKAHGDGEPPLTIVMFVYDDNCDVCQPGDRVRCTCIYKACPIKSSMSSTKSRAVNAVLKTYCDVIHIDKDVGSQNRSRIEEVDDAENNDVENMLELPERIALTESIKQQCLALSKHPDIVKMLVESLAPNIWGLEDVKKGLLCQLFGGTSQRVLGSKKKSNTNGKEPDGAKVRSRGEIHVLLCGDPSTSKSQLLQCVHSLAPRGVYAVGRGASASGLTATVTRDPDTHEFYLESGAVVLSDRGICCIDEFDKMDDSTRAILHEVMEQQTVSLAKGGIVCSVNARTAILASANPIKSCYDIRASVVENINLPVTLLCRFDLIYLVLDTHNETFDRRLANHLCGLYSRKDVVVDTDHPTKQPTTESSKRVPIDRKLFTAYISYARKHVTPELSSDAIESLINEYARLRQAGCDRRSRTMSATPRQLDALRRLSEALARMEFSETVEKKHVAEAARLMAAATYTAITDPLTGKICFEQLNRGISDSVAEKHKMIIDVIVKILEGRDEFGISREELNQCLNNDSTLVGDFQPRDVDTVVQQMISDGALAKTSQKRFVLIQ